MTAVVGIVMGSDSDWPTMRPAADVLSDFDVECEVRVVSAHRTPRDMLDYGQSPRSFNPITTSYSRSYFLHQKPSGLPVDTE